MNKQNYYRFSTRSNPMGTIGAILTFALVLMGIYFLIKGVYMVLGILSPVLLIATLIIDHKVVTGYLKFLLNLVKQNPVVGILAIILTIVGSPFVAGFLFAKAMMKRSLKKYTQQPENKNTYTEYEEVIELEEEEDFLILPENGPIEIKKERNDYDDLFKE